MKILWIWEIVLDKTYIISWEITHWQKEESHDSVLSLWWPVPSALKLLNNLWYKTTIVWSIWKWPLWKYATKEFKKQWIKTELIEDKATKVNSVIVNNITWIRTIIKDKIHNNKITKISKRLIKSADLIIFDRSEKEVFKFVLENKRQDTKIIIDPSSEWNDEIIFMTKNSTFPIFPIETIEKVSDKNDFSQNVKKLFDLMWKPIIITAWENWAFLYDWQELKKIESEKVCALDTNWAGDIFRWAFSYGILNNWEIEKTIIFANKVAWLQCTKNWNLTAVPSFEELKKLI